MGQYVCYVLVGCCCTDMSVHKCPQTLGRLLNTHLLPAMMPTLRQCTRVSLDSANVMFQGRNRCNRQLLSADVYISNGGQSIRAMCNITGFTISTVRSHKCQRESCRKDSVNAATYGSARKVQAVQSTDGSNLKQVISAYTLTAFENSAAFLRGPLVYRLLTVHGDD